MVTIWNHVHVAILLLFSVFCFTFSKDINNQHHQNPPLTLPSGIVSISMIPVGNDPKGTKRQNDVEPTQDVKPLEIVPMPYIDDSAPNSKVLPAMKRGFGEKEMVLGEAPVSRDIPQIQPRRDAKMPNFERDEEIPIFDVDSGVPHNIQMRADETTTASTTTSTTPPPSDCGQQLVNLKVGDSGNITSPNYPNDYPPGVKCSWWFQCEKGAKVRLSCEDVLTQSCDAGLFDYLLVAPNWSYENYSLICGAYQPLPFVMLSGLEQMSVFFRTSLKNEFRGFRCSWSVISTATTTTTVRTTTTAKKIITTTKKPVTTTTKKPTTTTDTTTTQSPLDSYNGDALCGRPAIDTRIVGGQVAVPHEFPWMVGLSFNFTWFCGGTLISQEWVLTAAHCTHTAVSSYAYIGAHDLFTIEEDRMVLYSETFIEHPDYKTDQVNNDIALVKLPKKVTFSDQIRPACLPIRASVETNLAGMTMVATGWGKTSDNATISPVLNKLNVSIITKEKCRQSYGDIIKDSNICAIAGAGHGTCQGDSGSSLQYEILSGLWVQEGIVSFGSSTGCGTTPPSGYTRIAYYLDFIGNNTGMVMK